MEDAELAVAALVREHWAPLLRSLIEFSGRADLAEDALSTAFERALDAWGDEVPVHPVAWLRRVAQRALIDDLRREQALDRRLHLIATDDLAADFTEDLAEDLPGARASNTVDDRIQMLWLACHPVLRSESRPVLALRFVLGLPTARIARMFLVPTATMAARITRAKRRLAPAALVGASVEEYSKRAPDVARALSVAYTASYFAGDDSSDDLVALVRHVAQTHADPALAALDVLIALTHARRDARLSPDGRLLTLAEQDRALWRTDEITDALRRYTTLEASSGYAEELRAYATIAAAHALAPDSQRTDWTLIRAAHQRLAQLGDSPIDRLEWAAQRTAFGYPVDPAEIARLLRELPDHHRVLVVAAHLRRQEGDAEGADALLQRAIELCEYEHEAKALRYLLRQSPAARG